MGKYCAMIPVSNIGSSHSFFEDRMTARPVRERKRLPKGVEVVKRTGLGDYRAKARM